MEKVPEPKIQPKTTNVFEFPVHKRVQDGVIVPPEFKKRQTQSFLTAVSTEICEAILHTLDSAGIDCGSQQLKNDMVIIGLALECAIYRTEGMEHEFSDFIDEVSSLINSEIEDEEGQ